MNDSKTAGIIIIGDEILSGKVKDVNSFFLAHELRILGVYVRRISVIPDEIEIIGKEVKEFSGNYDYVFTSGGVGPTHDDVTMYGIAKGFGLKIVIDPEIEKFLSVKYEKQLNKAVLKMAEVPEGAEILLTEGVRFPVVIFKNVFIFPGIPEYLKNKFSLIKERFRSKPFFEKRLFLNVHESEIAGLLDKAVAENQDVSFGSYPIIGYSEYRVIVTIVSKSSVSFDKAVEFLVGRLPEQKLVRIE
jgi:molybdenum cofactor synthesis domain-containing protein